LFYVVAGFSLALAGGCQDPDRVDDRGNTIEITPDDGPVGLDFDGDGEADAYDTDGDGEADAVDTDGDGTPDAFDTDGDGELDDFDGDGEPDPLPPGVDNGDLGNENQDGDGYCFDPESGWYECNDGADPGSGVPGTPELPGGEGTPVPDPNDPPEEPPIDDPNDPEDPPVDDPNDPPGNNETCDGQTFETGETIPPRILLVVDKSGSMGDPAVGYAGSKWDGATDALSDVVTSLEGSVEFGLMLYPDGNANFNQCNQGQLEVNVSANSADDIVNELNSTDPGGGTPTAATLTRARSSLDALGASGGSRVVVLATDGGPNCNTGLNPNTCVCVNPDGCADSRNCLDDVSSLNAAASLSNAGYSVFVVGIPGSENFTDVLNGLAEAGGTALPGTTKYYQADDSNQLATALEDISSRVASCRFDLQDPVSNATSVTVTVGSSTVAQDPNNGWGLVDDDTIELFGSACDQVVASPVDVTVDYCHDANGGQ
jgi:hypothetical protein